MLTALFNLSLVMGFIAIGLIIVGIIVLIRLLIKTIKKHRKH